MNIFKQILAEAKNMVRSKFILIFMIIAFVFITAGVPLFEVIVNKIQEDSMNDYYYYGGNDEDIVIDGVTLDKNNEFGWEIRNLNQQKEHLSNWIESEDARIYAYDLTDLLVEFYSKYAPLLKGTGDYGEDYRTRVSYNMRANITDLYILGLSDPSKENLQIAIDNVSYNSTSLDVLLNLTEEERFDMMDRIETDLADFDALMVNEDFSKFIALQRRSYENEIENNLKRIETLEADIVKNPDQEEYASKEIEQILRSNQRIQESSIPELDYRLEHNIVFDDGSWQDSAINSSSSAKSRILYATTDKMTKEEFEEDRWNVERYGSYAAYEASLENDRKLAENDLFVAESSLAAGKPDMSFVRDGARQKLYDNFALSIIVVLFSALLGGWCIATEFQSGTVRLLMIRPRGRAKVLATRFFAGLVLVYGLYAASYLVVALVQGVRFGFGDYFLPNYTASGEVIFGFKWLGDFFANSVSCIFIYSFSFAISTLLRNIAISIILPTLALLGSFIGMQILAQQPPVNFIAYTPVPYLTMYDFFNGNNWSSVNELIGKGVPLSVPLGIAVLLGCSAIFMGIAGFFFQKRDITN